MTRKLSVILCDAEICKALVDLATESVDIGEAFRLEDAIVEIEYEKEKGYTAIVEVIPGRNLSGENPT